MLRRQALFSEEPSGCPDSSTTLPGLAPSGHMSASPVTTTATSHAKRTSNPSHHIPA